MFGMFSLLNLLTATLYPIVASYKAYDNYSRLATQTGATTVNLGGVSIPLGTMFKKATSSELDIEEDTLNYRLLHVQMWLVYWIVYASMTVVEKLLLLSYFPFYSMFKLAVSLWLVSPIIISEKKTSKQRIMSFEALQQEWAVFSELGCGMIYFAYLKPFLDDNIHIIDQIRIDSVLSMVGGNLVMPLSQLFYSQAFRFAPENNSGTTYDTFSSALSSLAAYLPSHESRSYPNTDDIVMEEYDVVSKSDSGLSDELRNRQRKADSDPISETVAPLSKVEAKPSWFW